MMATTSLAAQLKNLEAPQTSLLYHKLKKTSFLFDEKEAASFDRESFFELGQDGLNELVKLNSLFEDFRKTLFDDSSKGFERAVHTSEVNEKLDQEVNRFFILLTPYFLLKPAHKAIEWLIHRFHTHQYNIDSMLMAALPYHETMMFARLLQVFELSAEKGRWNWLAGAQKHRVPLSKTALLNRASKDMFFLKFLCDLPLSALKFGDGQNMGVVFDMYCAGVVGGLEHATPLKESHVSTVLPSVLFSLHSGLPDLTSAAYIILTRLLTKITPQQKLVSSLYKRISKVGIEKMRRETCLMLVLLGQSDHHCTPVPLKVVARLSAADWLRPSLEYWTSRSVITAPFICSLLSAALSPLLDNDNTLLPFVENLLDMKYTEEDAALVFKCLLEKYKVGSQLDDWYREAVWLLESRNPVGFDEAMSAVKSHAINTLLGSTTSRKQLLDQLVHPSAQLRISALHTIANTFKSKKIGWLRDTVLERLNDDSSEVVEATLRCSQALAATPSSELITRLTRVLLRAWAASSSPTPSPHSSYLQLTVKTIIRHTTAEQNRMLALALLPVITCSEKTFRKCENFMRGKDIGAFLEQIIKNSKDRHICDVVWEALEANLLPYSDEVESILNTFSEFNIVYKFIRLLLIAQNPDCSISNVITDYLALKEVSAVKGLLSDGGSLSRCVTSCLAGRLPVQAVLYCVTRQSSLAPPLPLTSWPQLHSATFTTVNSLFDILSVCSSSLNKHISNMFTTAVNTFLKEKFGDEMKQTVYLLSRAVLLGGGQQAQLSVQLAATLLARLKSNTPFCCSALDEESAVVPLLLCLLHSEDACLRCIALTTLQALGQVPTGHYLPLVHLINSFFEEIKLDPEQVVVLGYTHLSPNKEVQALLDLESRLAMKTTLASIMAVLTNLSVPLFVKARLLQVLECVNSKDIFIQLIPLVSELVGKSKEMTEFESSIVSLVLKKLDESQPECFQEEKLWQLTSEALSDVHSVVFCEGNTTTNPASLLLKQLTCELYDKMPEPVEQNQQRLLSLIITKAYDCENVGVMNEVSSFFRRINIDGKILNSLLVPMRDVQHTPGPPPKGKIRRSISNVESFEILNTAEWKKGVYLLEQIQNKKKYLNPPMLLSILFDILKKCLKFEQEEGVEYVKQLVLCLVAEVCEAVGSAPGGPSRPDLLPIQTDLVVQTIRGSNNPQTNHHALIALTAITHILPDQVLHNMMDIFTFIGSSVLRQDDAYSFQIISTLLETIIPILVKEGLEVRVVEVVRVFVCAMCDIPQHRRLTLLHKLISCLGEEDHLWLFLVLVFESHVTTHAPVQATSPLPPIDNKSKTDMQVPKRMEITLNLCSEFTAEVLLKTICKLLEHTMTLPMDKEEKSLASLPKLMCAIFDLKNNSGKQLRHYRYTLVMFLSSLLSCSGLVQQVTELSESETGNLQDTYAELIRLSLVMVKSVSKYIDENSELANSKYWKVILNQCYEILDKAAGLMESERVLSVLGGLVTAEGGELRRKAVELVGWRLARGRPLPHPVLLPLVEPLLEASRPSSPPLLRQTVLFTLKLLVRHLSADHLPLFIKVLECLSEDLERASEDQWEVVGSLALCVGELVSSLKAHSIKYLNTFLPSLLRIIHTSPEHGDVFVVSVVTTLQKVVETLCHFLSPYLGQILYETCLLHRPSQEDTPRNQPLQAKLTAIRSKIASELSGRVLVPVVEWCFHKMVENEQWLCVAPLMATLADASSSGHVQPSQQASNFYMAALGVRAERPGSEAVELVEPHVISALTALVLKLSESAFRPLYHRLYDWALRSTSDKHRAITFYRLSARLAQSLRSLFVLFAGVFVGNAATMLERVSGRCEPWFPDESDALLLLDSVLHTLLSVFTHDSHHFLTKERFDLLLQPLVDQLENPMGGEEVSSERWRSLVTPCLTAMATASGDDTLWKQLNYQVLLKTRHQCPRVRLAGLECVLSLARSLGEDFLPLLPETVPFLAELLEDSDESIEKQTHITISQMEAILGEPIQKYF